MLPYRKYITLIIVILSVLASALIYLAVVAITESSGLRISRLTQIFALAAIGLLYVTVAIRPLHALIPNWQNFSRVVIMRSGLGLATTYFALLHVVLGFFGQLGGFNGLAFLNGRYLLAVALGFITLVGLILIALTGQFRKVFTRTIPIGYILSVLVLVHALMLGNHFSNILEFIPQLFFTSLIALLILYGLWADKIIGQRHSFAQRFSPLTTLSLVVASVAMTLLFVTPAQISLNVHNDHGLSSTGQTVTMPAAPATNEVVKIFQDYKVVLRKPGEDRVMRIDLERISTTNPDPVGQAELVLVNQTTYETLTLTDTLNGEEESELSFAFSLEDPKVDSGNYEIYAKFYLATGVLLAEFSIDL
jgi:hypothetical protein